MSFSREQVYGFIVDLEQAHDLLQREKDLLLGFCDISFLLDGVLRCLSLTLFPDLDDAY